MLMSTKWSGKRKLVEKRIIEQLKALFDQIRHEECGVEFWYARELMGLLNYVEWRNFENAIKKAMTSCHHTDISFMISIEETENLIIEVRAKKKAIMADKISADNIYKALIYFDKFIDGMTDVERRDFIEQIVSEVNQILSQMIVMLYLAILM